MKKATLLLHRKIDSERNCICGSKMVFIQGKDWCCLKQIQNKEPNKLNMEEVKKMKTFNVIDKNSDLVCTIGAESEEEAIKLIKIAANEGNLYAEECEE